MAKKKTISAAILAKMASRNTFGKVKGMAVVPNKKKKAPKYPHKLED